MIELITGIQQCGIGTDSAGEAAQYYKELFGMDALVFDDVAPAALMKAYTGNVVQERHAMLTMNMQGGGGFELWQFTARTPSAPVAKIRLGDLGIFAIKIKCADVARAFKHFSGQAGISVSALLTNPAGDLHFWITDKYGQVFNMVKAQELFTKNGNVCGGVCGAVIGVSNMYRSLRFYKDFMGINAEKYNVQQSSLGPVPRAGEVFHSILLEKPRCSQGAFSQLLGSIQIELVCSQHYIGEKIFANRFWGDIGFIHLCFDVLNMSALKQRASAHHYHFSVDSLEVFKMQNAGGRFCYTEDPDGTLIELVETHTVPIIKKIGWFLNVKKRKDNRPLPAWMIRAMGLTRVK